MSCTFTIIPRDGSSGGYVEEGNYWLLNFDQFGNEIGRQKEGNERFATVWISLDGSLTNNSFYQTETKGSWFDVERKRNEIIIRVQPNFTTEERDGYVEYAHNCDANKTCQICIHQCPTVYQIDVDAPVVAEETGTQINLVKVTTDGTDACGNAYSSGMWIDGDSGCVSELVSAATNGGTDECGNTYSVGDWIYGVTGCKVGDSNATVLSFAEIVNTYEVMFDKWNEGDVKVIPVTTKGGSGRFYVKSVKQYQKKGICTATRTITKKTETQITLTKAEEGGTDKCGDSYSAGEWIDSSTGCVSDLVEEATHIGVDPCGNVYNAGDWLYYLTECKVGNSNATTLTFDEEEMTGNECTDYMDLQVEYDDGLKLILEQPEECVEDDSGECPNCTGNGTLTIKSCGRTFVDEDNYYVITLAHLDYRFATCEIRVEYALPDRILCLSSNNILFNYNKKLVMGGDTSDSQTIGISFCETNDCDSCEEHPDYGYEYEIITDCCDEDSGTEGSDCVDCSWLTITENPTSVTVECEINAAIYDRSVAVKIYSIDNPDCSATLTVKQKGYTDYDVALSDEKITVDYDDTQTYEVYIYVYAYTFDEKETTEDEFWEGYVKDSIEGETCVDGDDKWVDVSYNSYRNTDFYTEITLNVKFTQNSGEADRGDCSLRFSHPTDSKKTATLTLFQYAKGNYKVISQKDIGAYNSTDKTITINMEATGDSYYLIASSTATWCSATVGGNDDLDVILKCTPNYWESTRYCVVTVTDTINSTIYRYTVEQEYCDENATDSECDPYEFSVTTIG
ncbi:MAG: hypothetical protein LUD72_04205 [Bacteroidales bacterium]|nr:hypothetical protein [Bacteroidales bacterium]